MVDLKNKKNRGSKGFEKEYWDVNYSDPETMDGIVNIEEHCQYLKALFALEFIDISSIIDFGFGLGHIFEGLLKTLLPYMAHGIEPSKYAFDQVVARKISPVSSTKLRLINTDLLSWCRSVSEKSKRFDLGVCTSVLQYLSEEELEEVLPIMAQKVKFLYLTVPTDKELDRQITELEFFDEYAIRRSRTKYQKLLRKSFTFVSCRLLESKVHFDEKTTLFTDLLYRY